MNQTYRWGIEGVEVDANDNSLGYDNTNNIVNSYNQINDSLFSIASICSSLNTLGYSDWYLPAENEFNILHSAIYEQFGTGYYWSSTEVDADKAYRVYISSSASESSVDKHNEYTAFCVRKDIYGCTDTLAYNYDEFANVDDGTCMAKIYGCTDDNSINYSSIANIEDNTCEYELVNINQYNIIPHFHSPEIAWGAYGLETNASSSNGIENTITINTIISSFNDTLITPVNYCVNLDLYGFNDWYLPAYSELGTIRTTMQGIYGNINIWTSNEYNSTYAYYYSLSNGNSSYTGKDSEFNVICVRKDVYGCTDSLSFNYDEFANINDGSCEDVVYGCLDDIASNYNPISNVSEDSCVYQLLLENEYSIIPYSHSEQMQWGAYGLEIGSNSSTLGAQNTEQAFSTFNSFSDTLITPMSFCYNLELFEYDDWYLPAYSELNYLRTPLQNIYGNIYVWSSTEYNATNAYNYSLSNGNQYAAVKDAWYDFVCVRKNIYGCTDSLAFNYTSIANIDDGSCVEVVYGCIDSDAYNFHNQSNTSDSSCIYLDSHILFEENFNEFYEVGDDNLESCWDLTQYYNSSYEYSIDDSPFLFSNSTLSNCDYGFVFKVQPTEGMDSLSLEFDYVFEQYSGSDLIYISADSIDWLPIENFTTADEAHWTNPSNYSVNLSYYLTDTLYIKFYRSSYSSTDYWAIDNIKVKGYYYNVGCTDTTAVNYNPIATINEGGCLYSFNVDEDYFIEYQTMEEALIEIQSAIDTGIIYIDLYEGWNMIGYTRSQEQDVVATLHDIESEIQIIKDNYGNTYWPEYGFNGIGNLIPGQGYQVKISNDILGFYYPNIGDQRIELNPTVPQWAIDMETQIHPNDIRTLVRVVNILGQEVNVENQPNGTTLLYLYNDGTVEKKIK